MNFDDYRRHDATALAELVASGQLSAAELLATAQARLEAVEPQINAVPIRMDEQARRQIEEGQTGKSLPRLYGS